MTERGCGEVRVVDSGWLRRNGEADALARGSAIRRSVSYPLTVPSTIQTSSAINRFSSHGLVQISRPVPAIDTTLAATVWLKCEIECVVLARQGLAVLVQRPVEDVADLT